MKLSARVNEIMNRKMSLEIRGGDMLSIWRMCHAGLLSVLAEEPVIDPRVAVRLKEAFQAVQGANDRVLAELAAARHEDKKERQPTGLALVKPNEETR